MQIVNGKKLPTVTDTGIYGFFGDYRFLSNYHLIDIEIDGIVYPSSEHAYMAQKTLDEEIRRHIATLPHPADAKKFGQLITLRPDWNGYRLEAMRRVLDVKFKDDVLAQKLLETGNLYLEETNDWGDVFWGFCGGVGKNMLGKTLMAIRSDLRNPPVVEYEPPLIIW